MSLSESDLIALIRRVIAENKPQSPTEDAVTHISSCPGCFNKAIEKMNTESEYYCADCHLPLGNKEFVKSLEKCPNCGGKHPKSRFG